MNFPLCALLFTLNACDGQQRAPAPSVIVAAAEKPQGDVVSALGKNIDWILEDKKGDHWFASNGDGVYHYDGRVLLHFTTKHGLCSDHVWSIQEDMNGYLWCSTRDGFCRFDGKGFTDFTATIKNALTMPVHLVKGGLCFGHAEGICYYDGRTFTNFTIHPVGYEPERSNMSRPYSIYCGLEDRSGNLWFGTEQKGVCRFDGRTTTWFSGAGLSDAAVRCVFEDQAGNLWFGNNGAGLFRYDGRSMRNVTEEKGLGNHPFLQERRVVDQPGTLARVWSITDDKAGNLWIGTIDAGVWRLTGNELTNYTTRDGLTGNSVWKVYKDRSGELWFVTNGDSICRFDGKSFKRMNFQ